MADRFFDSHEFRDHAAFVRRLARRLVHDETAAEDLVQDTWVAALERPPEREGGLRAWLARVLRNQAALRLRSGDRRRRREAAGAREEAVPETAELLERTELHASVVQAALGLPEPYRDVILRRFWQEEKPAEIARALGIPEPTVRTRLRRGLDQLRDRLRADRHFSAGLFLPSLLTLAREPGPVAPALPLGPSVATGLLTVLTMKKALVFGAVALAATLYWIPRGNPTPLPAQAEEKVVEPERLAEPLEVATPAQRVAAPVVTPEEPAPVEAAAAPKAEAPAIEPTPEVVGEDRGWLLFVVEDSHGNPVPRASIQMTQFSVENENGSRSSMSWYLEDSNGSTDLEGELRLWFPRTLAAQLGPRDTVTAVGFQVSHPDYVTHYNWSYAVAAEAAEDENEEQRVEITLAAGSLVTVSGWVDSPDDVITEVEAILDFESRVSDADWVPLADGRPSCAKVPPGVHFLYLGHAGPGGRWFSRVERFELVEGQSVDLHLELHPPQDYVGRLDDNVPRPIENGEVHLNLSSHEGPTVLSHSRKGRIEPDGTFRFENLPPGTGELVAICDGWACVMEVAQQGERTIYLPPRVDTGEWADAVFVLPMEPTGTAEVTVLDDEGNPLADASVTFWPNVHWSNGHSTLFADRPWHAFTDLTGRALIPHLPAGRRAYGVTHAEYLEPGGGLLFHEVVSDRVGSAEVTLARPD